MSFYRTQSLKNVTIIIMNAWGSCFMCLHMQFCNAIVKKKLCWRKQNIRYCSHEAHLTWFGYVTPVFLYYYLFYILGNLCLSTDFFKHDICLNPWIIWHIYRLKKSLNKLFPYLFGKSSTKICFVLRKRGREVLY